MKNQPERSLVRRSLVIRLAGLAILGLFIALAAAAYISGREVKHSSDLIVTDAVPGTIDAHDMRMAMSRSVGWMMVAASAQTTQSRDASIQIAHDADVAFTNSITQYKATIKINPKEDQALLARVISQFAKFQQQRMYYETLILAGKRDESAAFLETNLVPAYLAAIQPAEELLKYNNRNSITYANYIHNSVHRLYWAVAVVTVLALICAGVIAVNFTIRQKEVLQLRESEEKFSKAFRSSPNGIAITDLETGEYLEVNESFCRLLGYPAQELIGHTTVELGIWSNAKDRRRGVKSLLAGEALRDMESQTRTRDGSIKTIIVNAELIELGGRRCVVTLVQDITERKRAEEELIWKTAFLEAQVDSAPDGILVVDEHAKKILQNQRLSRLLNVPTEVVQDELDAPLLKFVSEQVRQPQLFLERVAYLYAHQDEIGQDEIILNDGRIIDRYSAPVRGKTGKYYGRIWTFRDVTRQRQLEEQFRQSQKMEVVGQLASGVAHDFNNILAVIQIQTEMLQREGNLSPSQLEYVSDIGESAQRAVALTRQLLLFSRKERMQTRELDFNHSINDMTKMLRRTLGADIELQFRFTMEPLFVKADPGMMDQVLMNLSVNARDAMPAGGKLVIQTSIVELDEQSSAKDPQSRPGSFACLSVTDTGCGIPPEILPKIFEPFFTTKEVGKGTGLGLATVFGIVQQHQGWVNVESEVGKGTTFRVYLPRLSKTSPARIISNPQSPVAGGNETILLAEDGSALRASIRTALRQLGYRILEAETAIEAQKIWRERRAEIALLLTDLVMPGGMTGKDLAESILKEEPGLKVIYMSGYSTDRVKEDFLLEDGVNFFTKPFEIHKLARAIRSMLDKATT